MAGECVIMFALFILGFAHQGLGLMSDYKKCGDPICERMMSRVQALQDHHVQDCRFLNFKKGDMIVVYYKLSGKSDLWAGSIEKRFGYFPKDVVKIDEIFVDETKEIQIPTQKYDFYCTDEFGSVIEYDEMDDQEAQSPKPGELGNNDINDLVSESTQTSVQNVEARQSAIQDASRKDPVESKNSGSESDQSGSADESSSISKQSHNEPRDESSDQESFRKLSLDTDENRLKEESQTKMFGWIGGELTNVLGFGQKDLKNNNKDITESIESPTADSSSWLDIGITDILGYGRGDTPDTPDAKDMDMDTDTVPKGQHNITLDEPLHMTEDLQDNKHLGEKESGSDISSLRAESTLDRDAKNDKTSDKSTWWYGRVYNRITNLHEDTPDKTDLSNQGRRDDLSEADCPGVTPTTGNTGDQHIGTLSESIFSVDHLSAVFDGLKSQLQLGTAEDKDIKDNEDETSEQTDTGKEVLVELQNNKDEKINDNDDLSISLSPIDAVCEMQSVPEQKHTCIGNSLSDHVRQSDNPYQEAYTQSNDAHESKYPETVEGKHPETVEEKVADEGIQTKMNTSVTVESSLNHTGQSQADEEKSSVTNKKDMGSSAEHTVTDINVDRVTDVHSDDTDTPRQPESQRGRAFPSKQATAAGAVSNNQGDGVTSVHSSDEKETVKESSGLSGFPENDKLTELLDETSQGESQKSQDIYSKSRTTMDTNEETSHITQVECVRGKDENVLVSKTPEISKSYSDDTNINNGNHMVHRVLTNREEHVQSDSHSAPDETDIQKKPDESVDGSDRSKNEAKQDEMLSKTAEAVLSPAPSGEGIRTDEKEADVTLEELGSFDSVHSSEHTLGSISLPEEGGETEQQQENDSVPGEPSPDLDTQNTLSNSNSAIEPQVPNGKMYLNLHAHLTEENMKDLLGLFGGHKLSWLDHNLGSSENDGIGQDNENLAKIRDFERTLEYYMKTGTRNQEATSPLVDNDMHGLLQKVDDLLSTLRKKFIPVIADGSVDKGPDLGQNKCVKDGCDNVNKDAPVIEQNAENVNQVENGFKGLSSNSSDKHRVSEGGHRPPAEDEPQTIEGDAPKIDQMTSTGRESSHNNIVAQVFKESEEFQNGVLYRYTAFVANVTYDVLAHIANEVSHLKDIVYKVRVEDA